MAMRIIPISSKEANEFVLRHHRHAGRVQNPQLKFSVGLLHGGQLVGVLIVGKPAAIALDDGLTAEVTRCCVLDDAPKGACSKLYAAAQKMWFASGGRRLTTYTLETESGSSLRGAGWKIAARVAPGSWSRQGRDREDRDISMQRKNRWEKQAKLPQPEAAQLARYTEARRTERRVKRAILDLVEEGKKPTKAAVARIVGRSRQQISTRYNYLFPQD